MMELDLTRTHYLQVGIAGKISVFFYSSLYSSSFLAGSVEKHSYLTGAIRVLDLDIRCFTMNNGVDFKKLSSLNKIFE